MKRHLFTLIVGLLLLLIFGLLLIRFQVRETEVAIVTTFGKPTRSITKSGGQWKWPWPIQQVHKFDKRVQNFEDRLTDGLTSDGFNLLSSVYVGWRITNPELFFPKFAGSADRISEAEKKLESVLGNIKIGVIGKHPLSGFISATDKGAGFLAIEQEILTELKSRVREQNYGLDIEFLGFKKVELPESVTEEVFKKMQSERSRLAVSLQSEGEKEAQRIRSEANRAAADILANADLQARQIQGQGEAEASKYLSILQRDPVLANFQLRLDALEISLKDKTTLFFDQHTPPFNLFMGVSTNFLNP
jgi:modulator of FtsH protease HflC